MRRTARLRSSGPEETLALGERLGRHLTRGDVVALDGELGAGKTVFTRGVASGVGLDADEVTSPTFTLVHRYEGGRVPLVHVDAYRLPGEAAIVDLGLDEVLPPSAAVVVEWASRVEGALPDDRLRVELTHEGASERGVALEALGPRALVLLAAIAGASAS